MASVTASDVVSDTDVAAVLEERTQEQYQFRRAYRPHDATDIDSGSFNFPQADDNVRGAMNEVGEESDYPRTKLTYSNVTANYTKDGFEIVVTDEAVSDSAFDVIMDVTEEMAVGAESRLDSLAWSLIDPNDGNNVNGTTVGGNSGDVDYSAIVDAYSVLFGAKFRPRDFELFVGAGGTSSAFNGLAKDNNFTHATEQGDRVVVQGELTVGFGVPVIPTNTGDLGDNEAVIIDTGRYGYESTRWDREVTTYREESKDADVFKIRHRKDFVVMKSDGAVFINGGTSA
jgi:hypothetical protein